jgi:hypothetical protein
MQNLAEDTFYPETGDNPPPLYKVHDFMEYT